MTLHILCGFYGVLVAKLAIKKRAFVLKAYKARFIGEVDAYTILLINF